MKAHFASAVAITLLTASSFAFAADNKGGGDGKKSDGDKTGSISSQEGKDQPSRKTIDECRTAPADDPACRNLMNQ